MFSNEVWPTMVTAALNLLLRIILYFLNLKTFAPVLLIYWYNMLSPINWGIVISANCFACFGSVCCVNLATANLTKSNIGTGLFECVMDWTLATEYKKKKSKHCIPLCLSRISSQTMKKLHSLFCCAKDCIHKTIQER